MLTISAFDKEISIAMKSQNSMSNHLYHSLKNSIATREQKKLDYQHHHCKKFDFLHIKSHHFINSNCSWFHIFQWWTSCIYRGLPEELPSKWNQQFVEWQHLSSSRNCIGWICSIYNCAEMLLTLSQINRWTEEKRQKQKSKIDLKCNSRKIQNKQKKCTFRFHMQLYCITIVSLVEKRKRFAIIVKSWSA